MAVRTVNGKDLAKHLARRVAFGKTGASPLVLLDEEFEASGADETQALFAEWAGKALAATAAGVPAARVSELLPEGRADLLQFGQWALALAGAAFEKASPKDGEAS